jgi:hypothetical protein
LLLRLGNDSFANMRAGALLMLLGMAASPAVAADPPPICADRPGKATSACTVPAGHWQLETGFGDWTLQKSPGERNTSLVIGQTIVKYGVSDSSDVEVELTPWERSTSRGRGVRDSASGFGDVDAIYKQRVTPADAPLQAIVMPLVKIPAARRALGNGKLEGGLLVPISYAIAKTPFSIGITPELDWAADADGRGHHAAMVQVASLGWQATARLNLSAEIWGQWDWDPSGTTREASVDAAAAYLLSNDVQLDAGANFGLNRETPDVELYGGLSVRL